MKPELFAAMLVTGLVSGTGCSYRLGGPETTAGPLAIRVEVENHTRVPGLSARLMKALMEEARAYPGVRLAAAAENLVSVSLTEAAKVPLSVDDLGRPVEARMTLKAEVKSSTIPQVVELDTTDLASALHRGRRTGSSSAAEEQAFSALARAVLTVIVEKGGADASR